MALPRKLVIVPNTATRELWRIAETGEIDELKTVLSRADINARNEHGMTALMRAAYHGRVEMVRMLLEHGADPNVARNDNFTALSLAAFFGHAEIVDVLMGHGAKTDVATRFGTSPYIWAKARCFGDVARSLERREPEPKAPVFAKPVAPPRRTPAAEPGPIVVRTLKDPPEIWNLVQEAPRNFDARAAFFARMGSFKGRLVMTVTLLALIGVAVGLGFYLKNRVSSVSKPAPTVITTTVPQPVVPQTHETTNVTSETPPVVTAPTVATVTSNTTNPRRYRSFPSSRTAPTEINNEQPSVETGEVNVVAPPMVVQSKPEPRSTVTSDTKKPTAPLSSQMVSPSKTAQPKAKVIQWP